MAETRSSNQTGRKTGDLQRIAGERRAKRVASAPPVIELDDEEAEVSA
jgi:hypothetical protein